MAPLQLKLFLKWLVRSSGIPIDIYLAYTRQVKSTFRAHWLASSGVKSQALFTSEQPKKNKMAFVSILSQIGTLWAASHSAGAVYAKTIIHLSVCESGGYLPRHLIAR